MFMSKMLPYKPPLIIANPIKVIVCGQVRIKDFRYVLKAVFDPPTHVTCDTAAADVANAVRI